MGMKRIPFSWDVYEGFAEADGLAHYDGETLWFEFQTKDSLIGLLKSDVVQVSLRVGDLESVGLKHRMLHSYLTLRARSLGAVEEFPSRREAEVELRFKRQYRLEVEELSSALALAISEAWLARLEAY